MKPGRLPVALLCLAALVFLFAIACSPKATSTPTPTKAATATPTTAAAGTPTPMPTATATPTKAPTVAGATPTATSGPGQPTATPTKAPTATTSGATATPTATKAPATPTATSAPRGKPAGSITLALARVGPPNFDVFQDAWPNNDRNLWFGIFDGLMYDVIENGVLVQKPSVASSWTLDAKQITIKLRPDVPWHDTKYGNLTADDVVFTYNRATAAGSKWTRADVFVSNWDMSQMKAVDATTVTIPWKTQDARWYTVLRDVELSSKKMFDEKGADYMNVNAMGTGPYKLKEMLADDHMLLEAVPNHWRETPYVAQINVLQVPEEATRIAMIKTGEADIIHMGLQSAKSIDGLKGVRFFKGPVTGTLGAQVALAGLYYETTDFQGKPTNRTPLTNLPWVGDPASQDSMNKAKLVRHAMAEAIDRESLVRNILAGQGDPLWLWNYGPGHPRWTPELAAKYPMPYDPADAKKKLADAGYPNGFDFDFWIPSGLTDTLVNLCQAMVPMFQNVGLRPKVTQTAYTTVRPDLLARKIDKAWCWQESGWNLDPASVLYRFNSIDVWNVGVEVPETIPMYRAIYAGATLTDRWKVIDEQFTPWYYDFLPGFETVSYVNPIVVGPRIGDWPVRIFSESYPRDLWNLQLAK